MEKIKLGMVVKDKVTGFTGVVLGITTYLTGCIQAGVAPQKTVIKDGQETTGQWLWFDVGRLSIVSQKFKSLGAVGGPSDEAPNIN